MIRQGLEIAGLLDEPRTEWEKFIKTSISQDPTYIDNFSLMMGRLGYILASLTEKMENLKVDRDEARARKRSRMRDEKDPYTGKLYSLDAIDRELELDPTLLKYRRKMIHLQKQISTVKGYINAMERKSNMVPGEQGRLNNWLRAEGRSSM